MAKLESLIVDLQVNSAALRKGLDEANAKLDSFGKKVAGLSQAVQFNAVANVAKQATDKLVGFVLQGAHAVDAMGKMAKAAGVAVEPFSKIAYAANLLDVSAEQLSGAFNKLNKNLAEAGAGAKEQTALFKALGVSVKDAEGKVRPADKVFEDLAERFGNMEDGASKAALKMQVFRKEGAKLNDLFSKGADGLKELGDKADRFGVTISEKAAKGAAEFNDNMTRLESAANGVAAKVAADLAPALSRLTDQLLNSKEGAIFLKNAVESLTVVIKALVSGGVIISAVFEAVGTTLGRTASAIVSAARGDFEELKVLLTTGIGQDIVTASKNAGDKLKAIWDDSAKGADAVDESSKKFKRSADTILRSLEDSKKGSKEAEEAMKRLEKVATDFETKVSSFSLVGPFAELEANLESGELSKELAKIGDAADSMKERILAAAMAAHELETLELQKKVEFDIRGAQVQGASDVASKQQAYGNIGASQQSISLQKTKGFADFDAALKAMAKQTELNARKLGEAEMLRHEKDFEGAMRAEEGARQAQRAAEQAAIAADGFTELAEIDYQAYKSQIESTLSAIGGMAQGLLAKMGDMGEVANSAIQGFEAGGWIGAIVAVIIDLFTRFERFGEIVELGNKQLQMLIDILAPSLNLLADAFLKIMHSLGILTKIIGGVLSVIIREISRALTHVSSVLTPIFNVLNIVFEIVGAVLGALQDFMDSFEPIQWVLKLLTGVINFSALTILGTVNAIELAWAEILKWLAQVFRDLGLDEWALALSKLEGETRANIQVIQDKMTRIWENIWDPDAAGDPPEVLADPNVITDVNKGLKGFGETVVETTKAVNRLSEAFTNVPTGFKTRLAQFNAMDANGGGALQRMSYTPPIVNVYISGGVMTTAEEIATVIEGVRAKKSFAQDGLKNPSSWHP